MVIATKKRVSNTVWTRHTEKYICKVILVA